MEVDGVPDNGAAATSSDSVVASGEAALMQCVHNSVSILVLLFASADDVAERHVHKFGCF